MIGISSYITSMAGLIRNINRATSLGMNTLRIASREAWLDRYGSDNRRFHKEYVDYVLKNTDLDVILDINHVYWETDGVFDVDGGSRWIQEHWAEIIEWCIQVAQWYANNDRVKIEVFNEYSLLDYWIRAQQMLDTLRVYTANSFIFNKWDQPWKKLYDPLDKTWYSYHFYFNYWSVSGALSQMDIAQSLGLKICNTEIGAHSDGGNAITTSTTNELNVFLASCSERGIGNMLWNTNNDQDFDIYLSRGLVVPAPQPDPTYKLTVIPNSYAVLDPAPGSYDVETGYTVQVACTPLSGYSFARWVVNGSIVPEPSTILTLTMTEDLTVQAEVISTTPPPGKGILFSNARVGSQIVAASVDIAGVGVRQTPFTEILDPGVYPLTATYLDQTLTDTVTIEEGLITESIFDFTAPGPGISIPIALAGGAIVFAVTRSPVIAVIGAVAVTAADRLRGSTPPSVYRVLSYPEQGI